MEAKKTYGCDDCKYLNGKRCKLWQVAVANPHDSHCESLQIKRVAVAIAK